MIAQVLLCTSFILLILVIYLFSTNKSKVEQYATINYDDNPNFTTNKLAYSAGYISSKNCSERCENRYNQCSSHFSMGETGWCNYLKKECDKECRWNSVFN